MESSPQRDDEAFLDEGLERLFEAWIAGAELPIRDLIDARPHLEDRILELARTTRLTAVQSPRPRALVAGYEIVQQLGHGGMGTVYLARQRRLGRLVALKVLPEHALASPRSRERFRREALVLASLKHPHIVTIHDVVEQDGVAAYTMEWIDGPTLAAAPAQEPVAACETAIAVLRALSVVHAAGLVHRDVSARNILLRPDGTPVLTDFGLVRSAENVELTRTGEFVGTAAYAAPEQLRGDHDAVGPAADQYAVGVLLFEALYRRHPFDGAETAAAVLRRMESGIAPQPRRAERTLSRDLEVVVGRALEFDPERRYESVDAFAEDLERVLTFRPVRAKPLGLARRLRIWFRRHRGPLLASVIAALVVAAIAAWVLIHQARRARLPAEVAAAVRAARVKLLDPDVGARMFFSLVDSPVAKPPPQNLLAPALLHYDRALDLEAGDKALAIEREVVLLARDLRAGRSATRPSWFADACPLTVRYAQSPQPLAGLDRGSAADRRALGLVAYLVGDPRTCVAAWSGLDLADPTDPLIDAALGDLYLSTAHPALAHPRLLRAARAFPESGHTVISAADAACQVGDLMVARRLISRARQDALENPYQMLQCVEADLLAADGNLSAARAIYGRIPDPSPGSCVKFARLLRRLGEDGAAFRLELGLVQKYPNATRFAELLCRNAESWWAGLRPEGQVAILSQALDRKQRHVLVDLLAVVCDLGMNAIDSAELTATPWPDPTHGHYSGRLRDLHLTRETLIMIRDSHLAVPDRARPYVAGALLKMDRVGCPLAARSAILGFFRLWKPTRAFLFALVASFGAIQSPAVAQTVVIDFDDGTAGQPIGSFYSAQGVTFGNAEWQFVQYPGSSGPLTVIAEVPTGTVGSQFQEPDAVVMIFASAVGTATIRVLDLGVAGVEMKAYDAVTGGNVIALDVDSGAGAGVGTFRDLSVSASGIQRVEIYQILPPSLGDGIALDNLSFGANPGQGNSALASLVIEGIGAAPAIGPFSVPISPGATLDLEWTGPANAGLILMTGPLNAGVFAAPGFGSLDLGTPPFFADLIFVFDGTTAPGSFFFSTGPGGSATHSFTMSALPLGTEISLQGLVRQPPGSTPLGFLVTATFTVLVN